MMIYEFSTPIFPNPPITEIKRWVFLCNRTIETLVKETVKGVKYVLSWQGNRQTDLIDLFMSLTSSSDFCSFQFDNERLLMMKFKTLEKTKNMAAPITILQTYYLFFGGFFQFFVIFRLFFFNFFAIFRSALFLFFSFRNSFNFQC